MTDATFKFAIGDIVLFKIALSNNLLDPDLRPNAFMVIERLTQECPGGVQLHYVVNAGGKLHRALECELISIADVDTTKFQRRRTWRDVDAELEALKSTMPDTPKEPQP